MKKLFPIVAFIAVALISLTMAGFAYFATQEAARIKFEGTADDALNRIESRIDLHLSLLRSTQALFDARNGDITRGEFNAFFTALDIDDNFAGLRGIGFLRLAKTGDEAAVERDILHDHGSAHPIYPAATLQSWRTPIVLFEPLDTSNQSIIGFDMFSEPVRRAAIEKAMADDRQHASGLVQLGQGQGQEQTYPGFLVFVRLNVETAPDVINASRSSTAGFLYAAFRARDLFQVALSKAPLLPVNVEIYDGKPGADNLLFRSEAPPAEPLGGKLLARRDIVVAGQAWTILFRPTSAFSLPSSRAIPVMLGLFGLLLAGAIALVARYQERAYEAKSLLHEATEKSLLEKDLILQEMKHRIKNSITRVLAIARQTASQATDVKEFSASFSARLQAMAASQDMLTRSRWQKADLGDLLRIELGQVFGKELPEGILSGPEVLLDETTTQALGLTFHELATNALKYGEGSSSTSSLKGNWALKVDWMVEGRGRERTLVLNWREAGQKQLDAPAKTGFGTKLIDLNVTRELGGTIKRDFQAGGLKVEIRIPLTG
ncbi:histidine kinase [Mesorhizobium sp. M1C.F.Ca.ET.193.01.1.1]|uniref:CHASE domain-containing protein n=2 Tax=Mesorhizobium TaxID=68287 RepID=UPI000FD2C8F4|nr:MULTISPECIES: CHASE domain-containing protein [unclassified Mesorhizobium]TGT04712.1 histidine kinase [bacterium M00.F.Ca.ET.177.01.1.1]TGQ57541.1 histidine kinase [Mesorhizobium sp. M1C.F.Ca.ET.210.01.1.1]TGQ75998.1 histidine kinase [Mesorhizobium sp. M1C.F.Ca.ET.212.01.1.1]TGR14382.1 histidine kinase [Mesorhizobium sp. M1C.F.Ca.ET.204.01.1.1]TGR35545.1 histidine kinase [Mesorhizobium sp. M1C.F.Ca.ET.196.01.1.1]